MKSSFNKVCVATAFLLFSSHVYSFEKWGIDKFQDENFFVAISSKNSTLALGKRGVALIHDDTDLFIDTLKIYVNEKQVRFVNPSYLGGKIIWFRSTLFFDMLSDARKIRLTFKSCDSSIPLCYFSSNGGKDNIIDFEFEEPLSLMHPNFRNVLGLLN